MTAVTATEIRPDLSAALVLVVVFLIGLAVTAFVEWRWPDTRGDQ